MKEAALTITGMTLSPTPLQKTVRYV